MTEGHDDGWAKLRAGMAGHIRKRAIQRQPRPIGPVGHHRIERIGQRDDPCSQRNRLAAEALRITRAIYLLVMTLRHESNLIPRVADVRKNLVAGSRVLV